MGLVYSPVFIYHEKSTKCREIYNSHGSSGYVFVAPFFPSSQPFLIRLTAVKSWNFCWPDPSYASWCKSSWVKTSLKKTWNIYDEIYDPWIPPMTGQPTPYRLPEIAGRKLKT